MNEYDYNMKYNKILNDFVKLDKDTGININKRNTEGLMMINDVFITYTPVLRRCILISALLRKIDKGLAGQWLNICKSLKKQKNLFIVCKINLKKYGINDEQLKAIAIGVKKYKERLIWIRDTIITEYLRYTPLKEYEEELIAKGQSLDELFNEYLQNNEIESEEFDVIADIILQHATDTSYLERLSEYNNKKQTRSKDYKVARKAENLENKKIKAQDKLASFSKTVHHNINHLGSFTRFDIVSISKYRKQGEKLVKIIIACKVNANNPTLYYVNRSGKLVQSFSNAMVLAEKDGIPSSIQEMVDEDKIVITEILFPA